MVRSNVNNSVGVTDFMQIPETKKKKKFVKSWLGIYHQLYMQVEKWKFYFSKFYGKVGGYLSIAF